MWMTVRVQLECKSLLLPFVLHRYHCVLSVLTLKSSELQDTRMLTEFLEGLELEESQELIGGQYNLDQVNISVDEDINHQFIFSYIPIIKYFFLVTFLPFVPNSPSLVTFPWSLHCLDFKAVVSKTL